MMKNLNPERIGRAAPVLLFILFAAVALAALAAPPGEPGASSFHWSLRWLLKTDAVVWNRLAAAVLFLGSAGVVLGAYRNILPDWAVSAAVPLGAFYALHDPIQAFTALLAFFCLARAKYFPAGLMVAVAAITKLPNLLLAAWVLALLLDSRATLAGRARNTAFFLAGIACGIALILAALAVSGYQNVFREDLNRLAGLFPVKSSNIYSHYYSRKRFLIDMGRSLYSGGLALAAFGIAAAVLRRLRSRLWRYVAPAACVLTVAVAGLISENAYLMTVNAITGMALITGAAVFILSFLSRDLPAPLRPLCLATILLLLVLSLWSDAAIKLAAGGFLAAFPIIAWFWFNRMDIGVTFLVSRGASEHRVRLTGRAESRRIVGLLISAFACTGGAVGAIRWLISL